MDEDNIGLRVELLLHLGFIKNIDLWQQGIYCIQISLLAGRESTLLAPVGIFSAPSRIDSYVGTQRIPALIPASVCHVEENDKVFRSRAFVVRYKDEEHVRFKPSPYIFTSLVFIHSKCCFLTESLLNNDCLTVMSDCM